MSADLIQEITVVGDRDHCVVEIDQKFLQPCDGIQIQMVGRLVQEQDIGIAEERLGQQDFNLLITV